MVYLSERMMLGLSESESNVFRNILDMSKSEIIKSTLKMCVLTHWEPKLVKINEVEKFGSSAFKCRIARNFSSPGCKDPSYRMKKFLTYI